MRGQTIIMSTTRVWLRDFLDSLAAVVHSAANRLLLCQRALLLEKLLLTGREERQVGMHHAIPSSQGSCVHISRYGGALGEPKDTLGSQVPLKPF